MTIEVLEKETPTGIVAETHVQTVVDNTVLKDRRPVRLPITIRDGHALLVTTIYTWGDTHEFHSSSTHVITGHAEGHGGLLDNTPVHAGDIEATGEPCCAGYAVHGT